jgi:hypothetical protein
MKKYLLIAVVAVAGVAAYAADCCLSHRACCLTHKACCLPKQ